MKGAVVDIVGADGLEFAEKLSGFLDIDAGTRVHPVEDDPERRRELDAHRQ